MNEKSYPRIGETVLEKTLPNGLKIFIVPKPQHRKKYAFFATRYGGMDMQFIRNGEKYDTPAGIAHYLEHKMFDTKDGNALQVLSQNGAEPNAFTSNAMTGYYFDCTEHFEENLRILLSFVSVPYFTDESVEKERGIIGQEIRMVEDSPDWQVYERLLACLYRSSPARVPIAGTVESIAGITAETLYDCHHAFYCPSNMALCVVGNVDPHTVIALAEEVLPRERGEEIARCYGEEEDDAFSLEDGDFLDWPGVDFVQVCGSIKQVEKFFLRQLVHIQQVFVRPMEGFLLHGGFSGVDVGACRLGRPIAYRRKTEKLKKNPAGTTGNREKPGQCRFGWLRDIRGGGG